jgi:peptide deformylase
MAVLPIVTLPQAVLRQKAKRVASIDASVKKLVADMRETLHADSGRLGLAAPQIGVSLRVAVIGMPGEEDLIMINP